jgi:hypothetical protein
MQRRRILATVGAASAILLAGIAPAQAADNRAAVIKEFACGLSSEASGLPEFLFTENKTINVISPSGNTVLQCRFQFPLEWAPSHTEVFRGFLCGTFLGVTSNSRSVVTPGGRAILTCIINPS